MTGGCVLRNRKPAVVALAVAAVAAAAALLPVTTASAATISSPHNAAANVLKPTAVTAAGIPIFHIPNGTSEALPGIHACAALGNDGTTQAVECADIVASGGPGFVSIVPQSEAMCQNLANRSVFPQCANALITMSLFTPGPTQQGSWDTEQCGHSAPLCKTPRQYFLPGLFTTFDQVTSCTDVWTVVAAGSNIELPVSAKTVFSSANLGSGHAIVCPG
jgi:hypothetical protein